MGAAADTTKQDGEGVVTNTFVSCRGVGTGPADRPVGELTPTGNEARLDDTREPKVCNSIVGPVDAALASMGVSARPLIADGTHVVWIVQELVPAPTRQLASVEVTIAPAPTGSELGTLRLAIATLNAVDPLAPRPPGAGAPLTAVDAVAFRAGSR
jgi:hypothetical protein